MADRGAKIKAASSVDFLMVQQARQRFIAKKSALLVLYLSAIITVLLVLRWAILSTLLSEHDRSPFAKLRLNQAVTTEMTIERLGLPTARLRQVLGNGEGQDDVEIFIYRKPGHELELRFVDGALHDWSHTKPFDEAQFRTARRLTVPCCREDVSPTVQVPNPASHLSRLRARRDEQG
jgi:hypothetical protein